MSLLEKLEQKGKKVKVMETDENGTPMVQTKGKAQGLNDSDEANFKAELQEKNQALEKEKEEKEELARLISELEKKMVVGGHAVEEKQKE